jgi:VIT1/CCC1 family predicted Fe2+/Mn2+ transporter
MGLPGWGTGLPTYLDSENGSISESVEGRGFDHMLEKGLPPLPTASTTTARWNTRLISDATIGLSDGLTVPFALTAGLSALGDTRVVIFGGLAELIAGAISMGLGGYLGARGEAEAYSSLATETKRQVQETPNYAALLVRESLVPYQFPTGTLDSVVGHLKQRPEQMGDFIMRVHHNMAETSFSRSRAYLSALTIAAGYFVGGFVPLLPYLFLSTLHEAFIVSCVVMAIALFAFGFVKTRVIGEGSMFSSVQSGVQMVALGGLAAAAAMGCVRALGSSG